MVSEIFDSFARFISFFLSFSSFNEFRYLLKLKSESDDIESIDINGYELLLYKNNYYLKNNNTNELYDIKNKKPNKLVGIIKSSGKVKFNN